jgi:hypothetical protein
MNTKKSLDKLKVSIESRSVGVVEINRECYGSKCSTFYINTIEYLPWLVHFARLVILAVGVPTWKLAWNFSAQQVQAEL